MRYAVVFTLIFVVNLSFSPKAAFADTLLQKENKSARCLARLEQAIKFGDFEGAEGAVACLNNMSRASVYDARLYTQRATIYRHLKGKCSGGNFGGADVRHTAGSSFVKVIITYSYSTSNTATLRLTLNGTSLTGTYTNTFGGKGTVSLKLTETAMTGSFRDSGGGKGALTLTGCNFRRFSNRPPNSGGSGGKTTKNGKKKPIEFVNTLSDNAKVSVFSYSRPNAKYDSVDFFPTIGLASAPLGGLQGRTARFTSPACYKFCAQWRELVAGNKRKLRHANVGGRCVNENTSDIAPPLIQVSPNKRQKGPCPATPVRTK